MQTEISDCLIKHFFKQSAKEDTPMWVSKVREHYKYKGLGNQADLELDMIYAICTADVNYPHYCILIECS